MFKEGQLKSLGIATALIILNIALMWVFAFTPLSALNDILFDVFIVGVIVYGAMLTIGLWLAKKGIRNKNNGQAIGGTALIQIAYGLFGAGILSMVLAPSTQAIALAITGVITTVIAIFSGLLVFGSSHDFSSWGKYANYIFLGVLGISLVGSFSAQFVILAFFLALIGFIVYLIHQIYVTKTRPNTPFLNGIGLYTAYMGVFVEILQLVIRMLIDE